MYSDESGCEFGIFSLVSLGFEYSKKMGNGPFSIQSSLAKAIGTNLVGPLEFDGQKVHLVTKCFLGKCSIQRSRLDKISYTNN